MYCAVAVLTHFICLMEASKVAEIYVSHKTQAVRCFIAGNKVIFIPLYASHKIQRLSIQFIVDSSLEATLCAATPKCKLHIGFIRYHKMSVDAATWRKTTETAITYHVMQQ